MKRYWLASLFSVGIICGLSSVVFAVDLEAVLKDNTANSGFSVKDASGNTIARFTGEGKVGIGTTAPSSQLHVFSDSSISPQLRVESSVAGSYPGLRLGNPARHWNVWADGTIGDKFAVYDQTTNAYRLVIDPTGNVGIGTTNPSWTLDVTGAVNIPVNTPYRAEGQAILGTGDSSYTYLRQYGAAEIQFQNAGGAELARITSAGNVGIGTTTPLEKLHVNGNVYIEKDQPGISLKATSGTQQRWITWVSDVGNYYIYNEANNAASQISNITVTPGGNVGIGTLNPSYKLYVAGSAYSTGGWSGSDVRWKKDITPLENSLNNVLKLQGVHYYWKTDEYPDKGFTKEKQIGLIAQDVEKVIPELVNTSEDGYKSVSYEKLTAVLVEAVKELKAENNKLKSEVNELRTLINNVIEPPVMPALHKQSCAGVYDNDGI